MNETPRLYQRFIAPILYYPGQSYEPKKKYIENPVVWYPEEMEHELKVKYQDLNTIWDILGFEEKYEVYTQMYLPDKHESINKKQSAIYDEINSGVICDMKPRKKFCD